MKAIELSKVFKNYDKKEVLLGVDLDVEEGEIVGLIGENGAGKTTTIKILLGLESHNSGSAKIFGEDCWKDIPDRKKQIGFASETVFPPDFLTVQETLNFHGKFFPSWDQLYSENLLKDFALDPTAKVSALSRGQNARLKLILAFSHRPKLIIIDEITAGLDALVRHDLINYLLEMSRNHHGTIFLTTNVLYDLEKLATRIALLQDGKIAVTAKVEDVLKMFAKLTFRSHDVLALLPDADILEKSFDEKGVHIIVENTKIDHILGIPEVSRFNPTVSMLDMEQTFVHLARNRKKVAP